MQGMQNASKPALEIVDLDRASSESKEADPPSQSNQTLLVLISLKLFVNQ